MSARSFDLFGTRTKFGNIRVDRSSEAIDVYLHNNHIARVKLSQGLVLLSAAGWYTPTTKTAINNVLSQIKANFRVKQVKGDWFIVGQYGKQEFKSNEWYRYLGDSELGFYMDISNI